MNIMPQFGAVSIKTEQFSKMDRHPTLGYPDISGITEQGNRDNTSTTYRLGRLTGAIQTQLRINIQDPQAHVGILYPDQLPDTIVLTTRADAPPGDNPFKEGARYEPGNNDQRGLLKMLERANIENRSGSVSELWDNARRRARET